MPHEEPTIIEWPVKEWNSIGVTYCHSYYGGEGYRGWFWLDVDRERDVVELFVTTDVIEY